MKLLHSFEQLLRVVVI